MRLWGRLPPAVLAECALLPQQAPQPPHGYFTAAAAAAGELAPVATSQAFFTAQHLQKLSEALVTSSLSHPRTHTLWLSLLALLLPGFAPTKVILCSDDVCRFWRADTSSLTP